jgi:hypothetical protein
MTYREIVAPPDGACSGGLQSETRAARLSPHMAWLLALAIAALVALGCIQGAHLAGARGGPPGNDSELFVRVVDHMRDGESYYSATVREQRALKYPLRPVFTVRLPTLAWGMAALPNSSLRALAVQALAVASFAAWLWRLRAHVRTPVSFALATLVMGAAHAPAFIPFGYTIHELWAGLLISLSLALWRPSCWTPSLLVGLAALAVRELAAAYFLAMGVLAWRDRRRGEAAAWLAGVVFLAAAILVHGEVLQPFLNSGDRASPGWLGLHGWRFVLLQMKWNLLLMTTPDWAAAVLAPLALLGLAVATGSLADRVLLVVAGYIGAFLIVGRPDNAYWGLIIAPLWPLGLYRSVAALRDVVKRAAGR